MTGVNLVRHEGLLALYRGINPAVARGLFYGGLSFVLSCSSSSSQAPYCCTSKQAGCGPLPLALPAGVRLGCYRPLKELLGATKENNSMVRNIAAGSLSGALAAWASNPIDLIKTRLQSKDNPQRTSGAVVKHILKEEGLRGLWRGTVPSTVSSSTGDLLIIRFAMMPSTSCSLKGHNFSSPRCCLTCVIYSCPA